MRFSSFTFIIRFVSPLNYATFPHRNKTGSYMMMEGSVARSRENIHITKKRIKDSKTSGNCGKSLSFINKIIGKRKCFSIIQNYTIFSKSMLYTIFFIINNSYDYEKFCNTGKDITLTGGKRKEYFTLDFTYLEP
jgi:hypothetical protein